jgi:hypothetical protein
MGAAELTESTPVSRDGVALGWSERLEGGLPPVPAPVKEADEPSMNFELMIVANVVPRPPRSSYNLLNLRDCGSVGDLVYRVLDLVVDACGVLWRTPNRCGDGERGASCTTTCVCRFRSDLGAGTAREGCTTGELRFARLHG